MMNSVASGGRLPSEYQEVEWIGSDGTNSLSYIAEQSGSDYEHTFIFEIDRFGNYNALITEQLGGNGTGFRINQTSHKLRMGYRTGNWSDVGNALSLNTKYKVVFDKNGVSLDDTFISTIPIGNFNSTLSVLNIKTSNQVYGLFGKTYSIQCRKDGNLIRDLVPCYRKSDNVIGMYDLIDDEFLTKLNGNDFTKGNDVN